MNDPERTERLGQQLGADRAVGDPPLGGLAPPRPERTQTADDLRAAATLIRGDCSRSDFPRMLVADRLEAHADALDAAVAAGEPCPTCAERMVPVAGQPDEWGLHDCWWRFVTPEAEK